MSLLGTSMAPPSLASAAIIYASSSTIGAGGAMLPSTCEGTFEAHVRAADTTGSRRRTCPTLRGLTPWSKQAAFPPRTTAARRGAAGGLSLCFSMSVEIHPQTVITVGCRNMVGCVWGLVGSKEEMREMASEVTMEVEGGSGLVL
jgi:hypothetical protein